VEIYAFVGPSGTGKSQRALPLAISYGIRYIIDDGLLIKDGRIIAGFSAKSELSKVRAIRRALFQFEDHRRIVVEKIREESPDKLLIIATSEEMVQKICKNLELPLPRNVIYIYDIASPKEINQAKQEREKGGKHVIPVPLVEVEKSFRGQLVGRIKFFFSGRREELGEKVIVRPPFSLYGRLSITEETLKSLVNFLVREHSPYVFLKSVSMQFPEEGMIELALKVEVVYGISILLLMKGLRFYLKNRIEELTGMVVNKVDIEVVGVRIGTGFRGKATTHGRG